MIIPTPDSPRPRAFFPRPSTTTPLKRRRRDAHLMLVARCSLLGLYLAGAHHLLAEVVLVLADAAVPATGGLVLADHDVLGDLVEESG